MKKRSICIIILLSVFCMNAQNKYAEIKYFFKINNGSSPIVLDCALLHNMSKNKSTFINFGFNSVPEEKVTEMNDINGDFLVNIERYDDNGGQKPEYQKFFMENSLVSHESVYGEKKYHLIEEKIPTFNWKIESDTLTILNQKTQKATVRFRGRDYNAWFTTDIQISDGPYKFHGLPGLILKIESVDKKFTFEAYSIKLNIKKEDLSIKPLATKYPNKKQITIKEKLQLVDKNTERERKYRLSKNPNATDIKIEHSGIEINFDDVVNER